MGTRITLNNHLLTLNLAVLRKEEALVCLPISFESLSLLSSEAVILICLGLVLKVKS